LNDRLASLYDALTFRDAIEILILAAVVYLSLRFLGRTRGAGVVRGFGLIIIGLFLVAQVVVSSFDLSVLGRVLDYLLTAVTFGMLLIFQPEMRRGLLVLGRSRFLRFFAEDPEYPPMAEQLADAAIALSREQTGALIVLEREATLDAYIETGDLIDAAVSPLLIRSIFNKHCPLHDGALILSNGRIAAAACQLPLGQPPENVDGHLGMRHRAGLAMSEETDAILIVVSEETGRISLAVAGRLEPVPRDQLLQRLTILLRGNRTTTTVAPPPSESDPQRNAA
jgi:diadenylate cyclase